MNQGVPDKATKCPLCSRVLVLPESLCSLVENSQHWLSDHPPVSGDLPSSNNIKQMLSEGYDFASVVLKCVEEQRVAPAYANFRCVLERLHHTLYFIRAEDANWEFQSMARQQETLDRKLGRGLPEDREWVMQRLGIIRHWNRQPDENGKPISMRKHKAYGLDVGEMLPNLREFYEVCSLFVHPTYTGEQNVGRTLAEEEADFLISQSHLYVCCMLLVARSLDAAIRD